MNILYIPKPVNICYGLLYNWWAATDAKNIAAADWSVPSDANWTTLANYLIANGYGYDGSGDDTGKAMAASSGWAVNGTPGTVGNDQASNNASGFSGKSTRRRLDDGTFSTPIGTSNRWWSGTQSSASDAFDRYLYYSWDTFERATSSKKSGYTIRLLKDSTLLTHGQTSTYIGNDGKTYRTICIGTQEWLAENLEETKYRDGDPITEVTDPDDWAALSTEGMCAYNNDWGYTCRIIGTTTTTTAAPTTTTTTTVAATTTTTTTIPCEPHVVLLKGTNVDYATSDDAYNNRACSRDYYIPDVISIPTQGSTLYDELNGGAECIDSQIYVGNYQRWIATTNATCDGTWYTVRVNAVGMMNEVISH
jgi:uncharacterized protein (TIGR02145 family)